MTTLRNIIDTLELKVLTEEKNFSEIIPTSGYASDMLSCVMASCKPGGIWVTLQSHLNIVGVAALVDVCAVILTEGAMPDEQTVVKANQQGVTLLSTPKLTYRVCGCLWEMGIKD